MAKKASNPPAPDPSMRPPLPPPPPNPCVLGEIRSQSWFLSTIYKKMAKIMKASDQAAPNMEELKYFVDQVLGIKKMKKIFKYPIQPIDYQEIEMPIGAQLLSVQLQKGAPVLWAVVNEDNPMTKRCFATRGTGHPIDGQLGSYLGTYQLFAGDIVFHVFEVDGNG